MSQPIIPVTPVNAMVSIQPLNVTAPSKDATGTNTPLANLPAGTNVEGYVINRDAQNNPILRTAIGDFVVDSSVFLKTGSAVLLRVDPSQTTRARIVTVDGLSPEEYDAQNAHGITEDTIATPQFQQSSSGATTTTASGSAAATAQTGDEPAALPMLKVVVLQPNFTGPTAANTQSAGGAPQALTPPDPIPPSLTQLPPGTPLTLTLVDVELPPLPVSLATIPEMKLPANLFAAPAGAPGNAAPLVSIAAPTAPANTTLMVNTAPPTNAAPPAAGANAPPLPPGAATAPPANTANPAAIPIANPTPVLANAAPILPGTLPNNTAAPAIPPAALPGDAPPSAQIISPAAAASTSATPSAPTLSNAAPTPPAQAPNAASPIAQQPISTTSPNAAALPQQFVAASAPPPSGNGNAPPAAPLAQNTAAAPNAASAQNPPAQTPSAAPAMAATIATNAYTSLRPAAAPGAPQPANAPPANPSAAPTLANTAAANSYSPTQSANPAATTAATTAPTTNPAVTSNALSPEIRASVIGHEADGANILQTPFASLKLYTQQPLPSGTTLIVRVARDLSAPEPSLTPLSEGLQDITSFTQDWQTLADTLTVLQANNPALAARLAAQIPSFNALFTSNMLFFLAAVKGGSLREWLDARTIGELETAAPGLLAKLGQDIATMQHVFVHSPLADWSGVMLPFLFGSEMHQARLYVRNEEENSAAAAAKGARGQRFVVECDLSHLGEVQLDGFIRDGEKAKTFDLVVRTSQAFAPDLSQGIRGVFENTLQSANLNGQIIFQSGAQHFVRPLASAQTQSPGSPPQPILA